MNDHETGYSICYDCGDGVHLHRAGYDIDLKMCSMCKQMVADKNEFLSLNRGAEILGK